MLSCMTIGPFTSHTKQMSRHPYSNRGCRRPLSGSRNSSEWGPQSRNGAHDGGLRRTSVDTQRIRTNARNASYPQMSTNNHRNSFGNPGASGRNGSGTTGNSVGIGIGDTFAPIPFHRFQTAGSPFTPHRVTFPPPRSINAPAVWSWQMGEAQWVPFDTQVSSVLETLWSELQQQHQQDDQPHSGAGVEEQRQHHNHQQCLTLDRRGPLVGALAQNASHKVYVCLPPWQYCIDLDKMLQQNICTQRVRPIRRTHESAALWFFKGEDGFAQRFDPVVELHLEELQRQSLLGSTPPDGLVVAWQEAGSRSLHFTDVGRLIDTTDGDVDTAREVVRMEIAAALPAAPTAASGTAVALPSLSVGTEESGEALCTGHEVSVVFEDCQAALQHVDINAIPEDACAICLDSLLPDSSSPRQQHRKAEPASSSSVSEKAMCGDGVPSSETERNSEAVTTAFSSTNSDNSNTDEVVKLKECPHHFHMQCIQLYVQSSSRGGFVCPTCNVLQLAGNGPSPPGKMLWTITNVSMLSGHPYEGTIIIQYIMEGGVQTERHAHPRIPFSGTRRTAYLPDCLKGRQLLRLLIQAFVKGHLFTVGDSVSSGQSNVVIWNGIHHKTSVSGGVLHYGYPDETFLSRLAEELSARGFQLDSTEATDGPAQRT